MDPLETLIAEWRTHVSRITGANGHDVEELEAHLRDQIVDLGAVGLSEDEAFLIAVRRLGEVNEMSREFATEHSGRLWRQLTVAGKAEPETSSEGLLWALGLAVLAGIAIQILRLIAREMAAIDSVTLFGEKSSLLFPRNAGLVILPFLAWYFARKHRLNTRQVLLAAVPFLAAALAVNLYPWAPDSSTEVLVAIHLPVALWFAVAISYMGGTWGSHERRMDFVRFTGEWFIYYVLIALGGFVLLTLTAVILEPTGSDVVETVLVWALPSGAAGAVIVAAWLVEEKKSVVENMAPVLTLIFTPLFAVMLAASAIAYAVSDLGSEFDREAIFVLDILLVVVLGLVLYGMSARESDRPTNLMDRIQLVAVVGALALDIMVLSSMVLRISELGLTPNRVAALGLNLVLLVNLGWAAWLSARFISNQVPFHRLERWQTEYFPAYGVWTAAVVLVLPLLFAFA
ncbi:MAG: permease prefix domain 1-containing protein [Actinomycetota bacterium]|nr:permease prefix domain 1-containing protein [Actinomycetota bacterium]